MKNNTVTFTVRGMSEEQFRSAVVEGLRLSSPGALSCIVDDEPATRRPSSGDKKPETSPSPRARGDKSPAEPKRQRQGVLPSSEAPAAESDTPKPETEQ